MGNNQWRPMALLQVPRLTHHFHSPMANPLHLISNNQRHSPNKLLLLLLPALLPPFRIVNHTHHRLSNINHQVRQRFQPSFRMDPSNIPLLRPPLRSNMANINPHRLIPLPRMRCPFVLGAYRLHQDCLKDLRSELRL